MNIRMQGSIRDEREKRNGVIGIPVLFTIFDAEDAILEQFEVWVDEGSVRQREGVAMPHFEDFSWAAAETASLRVEKTYGFHVG